MMSKTSRKQAFLLHALLSVLAVGGVASFVVAYWYPWDLLSLQGADKILLLIVFIDVILGPSLTLLVYKPGKRFLVLDLTIIAAIQIAALSYGTYTLYHGKASFLVFSDDQFYALKRIDLIGEIPFDLAGTQRIGPYGPHIVEVEPLSGSTHDITAIMTSLMHRQSLAYIAPRYKEFPTDKRALALTSLKLNILPVDIKKKIQKSAEKLEKDPENLFYYPVQGKAMSGFAVFTPEGYKLVDIIAHKTLEHSGEAVE
ncbi:MAG: hypothetical protein P8163_19765 [Candidatus Thiodiazotropha sp.]